MSEENKDVVREIHVSDEDFVNALGAARGKQDSAEQEELQQLAARLSALQQRLSQVRETIKRERAFHELELIDRMISSCCMLLSDEHPSDELVIEARAIISRALKVYSAILEREFSEEELASK